MVDEFMLESIDPNDHQNLSKWLVLGSVECTVVSLIQLGRHWSATF